MSDLPDIETLPESSFEAFKPSPAQALAKTRLQAALEASRGFVDVQSLTREELVGFAGDRRVTRWLSDPRFAAWLTDRDTFVHQAVAMRETALGVLGDIILGDLEAKVLTAGDKLKAIDILLKLTGSYPRLAGARFLDRDLDSMDEAQVERELTALKSANPGDVEL